MDQPTTRRYRKRKRAEAEEETRRRITEAAVELHGSVGPAGTTITDIANRAGVSRMTVYNHFPDEVDLFTACSSHWATENPFPDPTAWEAVAPEERLVVALRELYGWYRPRRRMLANVLRDAANLRALSEVMEGPWGAWTDTMVRTLAEGRSSPDAEALGAALRLAVDFHTWEVLTGSGLDDAQAAELMARLVSSLGTT